MKKKLIIFIVLLISLIILSGCGGSSGNNGEKEIAISGNVNLIQDDFNNLSIEIFDSSGTSIVNTDESGKWTALVEESEVIITPIYNNDNVGKYEYIFSPQVWREKISNDKKNINFVQYEAEEFFQKKFLGEWEFSYSSYGVDYIDYYIFDEITKTEDQGNYNIKGYKEKTYSSTFGYEGYQNEKNSSVIISYRDNTYSLLWFGEDREERILFDFISETEIEGKLTITFNDNTTLERDITGVKKN